MRTTNPTDEQLFERAAAILGVSEKATQVREGLRALIERESARQLARMGGTEPDLVPTPRRRPAE